ncbi:hypothetical protein C3488_02200 [Streptomyces sp. Ru72]|nr:hypothetical protein C3488_02200 [Streptomyces sp. Ru72]
MTPSVDLVPGLITTRDAIAAAYGCGTFQSVEPADKAGKGVRVRRQNTATIYLAGLHMRASSSGSPADSKPPSGG